MKKAFVFPGQGAQFVGMGRDLYDGHAPVRELFNQANDILGFDIRRIMFEGTSEELLQTKVTQPAVFIHSVSATITQTQTPDMVAGHSLGEFSALVANRSLLFPDALKLVAIRAAAMQKACDENPSIMAAVLGLEDRMVEEICASVQDDIVVAANYNCPGQLVISGTVSGVTKAIEKLKAAGAKRTLPLSVSGAFHSPLMSSASKELAKAIEKTPFYKPSCPIYQNVNTQAVSEVSIIKQNLISQLTSPVLWMQSVKRMIADGATHFYEGGPGKVLQGLIKKIAPEATVSSL